MQNPMTGEEPREAKALVRFAAVQAVLQGVQAGQSLVQALRSASEHNWEGRRYSFSTIEDWYYRYRAGKFAGLVSSQRSDRGASRSMDPQAVEELGKLRREHPQLTVPALIAELRRRGILEEGGYSASTVHRRLAEMGLDRRSVKAGAGLSAGPTKAFEVALPNVLWMADCMHGPALKATQGETAAQRTFLFALLDDCSRLCVHGQFYAQERLEGFLHALRQAIQTRGLPDKLYTDNGAAFRSQHLGIVCANLGIRLLHCKPYHSWSKGKIERFFSTVQMQFLPTLTFTPVSSLEELNRRFWQWLETEYHQRGHAALASESPAQRFARLGTALRLLEANAPLDQLFFMRVDRRVRKDATFSLGADLWEVAVHLRGQVITARFDPMSLTRMEVWLGNRFMGLAVRCDKHRNARIHLVTNDYDREIY